MALIKTIKDKLGNIIYPQTREKAVYSESNERLDNKLSNLHVRSDGKPAFDNLTVGNRLNGSLIGENSTSMGTNNTASGQSSHAEGYNTRASGVTSHTEGQGTIAKADTAHAEGLNTKAYSYYSHAEGQNSQAGGSLTDPTIGQMAHAEGWSTIALGDASHSEGREVTAYGTQSHAEGFNTYAIGPNAHSENYGNIAGYCAHAEGFCNIATYGTIYAVSAYNDSTKVLTLTSVTGLAVGDKLQLKRNTFPSVPNLTISAISGLNVTITTSLTINGTITHAVKAIDGNSSHVEGLNNIAAGAFSHVEGFGSTAQADFTHSEGYNNTVTGAGGHAEGSRNIASNINTHAEGDTTIASGQASHAEGYNTIANGFYSHSGGISTRASGVASFSHGIGTIADGNEQAVFGMYNIADTTSLLIIGNGTSDAARSDAFVVKDDGQTYVGWKLATLTMISGSVSGQLRYCGNLPFTYNLQFAGLTIAANACLKIATHNIPCSGNTRVFPAYIMNNSGIPKGICNVLVTRIEDGGIYIMNGGIAMVSTDYIQLGNTMN